MGQKGIYDTLCSVQNKLWSIINAGILRNSSKKILEGGINLIDLNGIDELTQIKLSELILVSVWHFSQGTVMNGTLKRLTIVLDEFQNLPFGKGSILRTLLTEGRKY